MTSLRPPTPVSLLDMTSIRQPWLSAKREYMRNSSAANSAASSPPVPARISSITSFSSFGSFGMRSILSSATSASRLPASDFSSSFASSRMSASPPASSSSACDSSCATVLYSRYFPTSGSSSASAFACFRYSLASLCTSVVPSRAIRSSYRASSDCSLSNMVLSAGHRRQKRDLVAVAHRGVHLRVVRVERGRNRSLVRRQLRILGRELAPDGADRRARREIARQLGRARDVAQPCEQLHVDAHATRSACALARASSGSAVAPSIQTSPPS